MTESSRPGCLRTGCIGCLSALALVVGLVFLAGTLRMIRPETEPSPESRRLERPLPPAPPLPARPDRPPRIEGVELPPPSESPEAPEGVPSGVLVLDLSMGNFRIVPGAEGDPIRVEADYDTASFELKERYDSHPDGGWTWKVEFGSTRSWLGMLLNGGSEADRNDVEIVLPRGQPLSIVGKIGLGKSEIDLGGLWLERVDLELGTGEHFLEIREPLALPMEEMLLSASVGELELRQLGDASPRRLRIEHSVGELYADLQGSWQRDAEVEIDAGVGETRIDLPWDARIVLDRAGVGLGETRFDAEEIERRNAELPPDAPTLTLEVSAGVGEVRIER